MASTTAMTACADLATARPVAAGASAGSRKRETPVSPATGRQARPRQSANTAAASVTYLACKPARVANPAPPTLSRPMATGAISAASTQPDRIAHARQARLRYAQLAITTSAATAQDSCWSATGGLAITEPNDSHRHGPPTSPGTRVVSTRVDAKLAREAVPGLAAGAPELSNRMASTTPYPASSAPYSTHACQYLLTALTAAIAQRPSTKNAEVRANSNRGTTAPLSIAAMPSSSHPAAARALRNRPPRR